MYYVYERTTVGTARQWQSSLPSQVRSSCPSPLHINDNGSIFIALTGVTGLSVCSASDYVTVCPALPLVKKKMKFSIAVVFASALVRLSVSLYKLSQSQSQQLRMNFELDRRKCAKKSTKMGWMRRISCKLKRNQTERLPASVARFFRRSYEK